MIIAAQRLFSRNMVFQWSLNVVHRIEFNQKRLKNHFVAQWISQKQEFLHKRKWICQPSPATPSPAQPNPAQRSPAQPSRRPTADSPQPTAPSRRPTADLRLKSAGKLPGSSREAPGADCRLRVEISRASQKTSKRISFQFQELIFAP